MSASFLSMAHDAPIGFVDRLSFLAYFNSVYTQADTYTLRGATASVVPSNARASQFYYTQNVAGAELQMNTDTLLFGARNIFTSGLSFAYTTTTRPRDRWAIAAYLRALQLSQHASAADIPTEERQKLSKAPTTAGAAGQHK